MFPLTHTHSTYNIETHTHFTSFWNPNALTVLHSHTVLCTFILSPFRNMDVVYFDVLHVQHAQNTWGNNCFPLCPHVCPSADLMESFLLSLYSLRCCSITDEGLRSLLSAVRSNPSALRELWLDGNYPGPSALQLFSELQKDPNCKHINISRLSWIHSHFIPR